MIRHIALLTLRPDTTDEQRQHILDGLATLPAEIPALVDYRFGPDLGLAEGNATIAVVADCDDVAGYEAYRDHPAHVAVIAERIRPVLASRAAAQFEI